MSSFKLLAAAMLLSLVAGCGFEPIAAPTRPDAGSAQSGLSLSSLDIAVDDLDKGDRFVYALRRELNRYVDTGVSGSDSLKLSINLSESGLAIQQDDTVTRLNFKAETRYELSMSSDAEATPIVGRITSITAANATSSQFSTSVASRDAYERLAVDTARRVLTVLRLKAVGKLPTPEPVPDPDPDAAG